LSYLVQYRTNTARRRAPTAAAGGGAADGEPFFYHSAEMTRLMDQVRRIAPQDTTILLSGETGTGKTRLARVIHELSPRRDEPFLVVNCGALSSNLIESEMFGHVRGAFTGADKDRVGKFAEVGRGTLLLDEIDSLPLDVQAKLLRVVEDRIFEQVGSNKSQPVRARMIAACNRNLEQEAAGGRFRPDLYYRLNVVGFTLPPLRERVGAIAPLATRFLHEFATRFGWDSASIAPEALECLEVHQWPGNIRELRNVIERAVALSAGPEVRVDDLPDSLRAQVGWDSAEEPSGAWPAPPAPTRPTPAPADFGESTLAQIKRQAELSRITEALEKHHNNRLRAASELGISRMTLYKKLYKYGLMSDSNGRHAPPPVV
jgi:DNA-binding NtrC family response regulator